MAPLNMGTGKRAVGVSADEKLIGMADDLHGARAPVLGSGYDGSIGEAPDGAVGHREPPARRAVGHMDEASGPRRGTGQSGNGVGPKAQMRVLVHHHGRPVV